ncbi:MAG: hypothetical protein J0L66_00305 [Cytophagales bacterium]|nr:hypothetical protein [Cytophagales bacterium]
MRTIKYLLAMVILSLGAGSCFDPPEFPIEPRIEFENMIYKRVNNIDSLIFFITFTDGDGDLGLSNSDNSCTLTSDINQICFEGKVYDLYQNAQGQYEIVETATTCNTPTVCYNNKFVILKPDRTPIRYGDKRNNPVYASLPDFIKPYNCINWELERNNINVVTDTTFFRLNPNHYNFEIDFLIKQSNGQFVEFDFTKEFDFPGCGLTFDGRFPILYKDKPGSPMEGRIRFAIGSAAMRALFSLKTLKFRIQIKDRALHKSNIIETPEISF